MPLTKNHKIIIAATAAAAAVGVIAVTGIVMVNKNKTKPFFTAPAKFTKKAAEQQGIAIPKPVDIKNAGTIEFDYVPKWTGLPGASGQPLIRIGEYPKCFEIYQSGGDIGVIVFRVGADGAKDKYEPIKWTPTANKSYRMRITWANGTAALYIDGKKFTSVTGLDMAEFTSHTVLIFPPGASDADYSNFAVYNKAL